MMILLIEYGRKLVMENWRSVRKLFGFALLLLVNEERDEQEYVFV